MRLNYLSAAFEPTFRTMRLFVLSLLSMAISLTGCAPGDEAAEQGRAPAGDLAFEPVVVSQNANLWWARHAADINGDGLLDVALSNNNGHGGWLGWLEAQDGGRSWLQHVIAELAPGGQTFAGGDLQTADFDQDGDPDILAFAHPGEWDDSAAPTTLYWYENANGTGWTPHEIGEAPAFVKDVNVADFSDDGRPDVVTITYDENKMTVFRQDEPGAWTKVSEFTVENLHEGMDVGDIDGDGDVDIAANGYWIENPGGDLTADWPVYTIDQKWHDQTGDWSKNAAKVTVRDITGDGRAEVFISHSERAGYPLAWYEADAPKSGTWTEHVIVEDWPAAQSMQIADMDLDGDYDVVAGVNRGRARNLGESTFPVTIFLNEGEGEKWSRHDISQDGIYNGELADVDGDGDQDLFRLASHDADTLLLLLNQVRD